LVPGYDLPSSKKAVELSQLYEGYLYAAVGWHPHDADDFSDDDWEELKALVSQKGVVAIGETGLDFYKEYSSREAQRELFKRHIELALEFDLPIILHVRKAFGEVFKILEEHKDLRRGVFHCFSGGIEEAKKAVSMGFYISFSGSLTYSTKKLPKALLSTPLDRILVETDSPFLAPDPFKNMRNEPSLLPHVGEKVSMLIGEPLEFVARITTRNATKLFLSSAHKVEKGESSFWVGSREEDSQPEKGGKRDSE
jgi:TatD DNase family protein